jgi:hypothetical protein
MKHILLIVAVTLPIAAWANGIPSSRLQIAQLPTEGGGEQLNRPPGYDIRPISILLISQAGLGAGTSHDEQELSRFKSGTCNHLKLLFQAVA